jgi:hypothetical protein
MRTDSFVINDHRFGEVQLPDSGEKSIVITDDENTKHSGLYKAEVPSNELTIASVSFSLIFRI